MFSKQSIDDHNIVPELDSASNVLADETFNEEVHFSRMFGSLFVQPVTVPIGFEDKVGINFPTPLPLFESPPNAKAAQQWVAGHAEAKDSPLQNIAQKIINNLHYVSFEQFLAQLRKTVSWFNENVKDPYVLWIPQEKRELSKGCSDIWVAGLAIEHANLRLPHAIVCSGDLLSYLNNNPTIKTVLALDDAAYSGNHLCDELYRIRANKSRSISINHSFDEFNETYSWSSSVPTSFPSSILIYVGIPFATEHAKKRISDEFSHVIHFIEDSYNLKTAESFLSPTDLDYLNSINIRLGSQTLTYFDHRFPDHVSTLEFLEDGRPVDLSGKKPIRFVPQIISPYRLHHELSIEAFRNVHQAGGFGVRTRFNPPKRYEEVLEILHPSSGTRTIPISEKRSKSLPIVSKWARLLASCETEPESKIVEKITRFFLFHKPDISKLPMKYMHSDGVVQSIRPVSGISR